MPGITQTVVNKSRRVAYQKETASEILTGLLKPFRIQELYPPIEEEVAPGRFETRREIQPHQQLLHDGYSLTAQKARRLLSRMDLKGLPPETVVEGRTLTEWKEESGKQSRFCLLSGGYGSGKSYTLSVEIIRLLRAYPGIKVVVVAPYDYYFDESVLPTWNRILDLDESELVASWNRKERLATLTNGSTVRFKAYDDPMKVKGWEAHVIWIEEASELGDGNNEKAIAIFNALLGRLRASSPKYPLRMYVSQNPRGHNWVWKTFVKSEPHAGAPQPLGDGGRATPMVDRFGNPVWKRDRKGKELVGDPVVFREFEKVTATGDIFYTISTGTHANQYVPPAYVATMLGQYADTPGLRERFVDGMFTPINSLVYEFPIFSKETHCIDYAEFLAYWEVPEIPSWWPVRVGIDCAGLRSPWAIEYYVLAGGVPGGHWVGFDEIYVRGKTYGQIIDLILDKVDPERGGRRWEDISYWIDPISSQQRNAATAETLETEFARRGIPVQMPKHYSYYGGIAKIHSFLHRNKDEPNPYLLAETLIEDESGNKEWDLGAAGLYYLKGMPGKPYYVDGRLMNEEGQAMPANIAEKGVFRMDDRKQREGKESEEGLTPFQTEKVLRDRDDHAQTAEFFALWNLVANDIRGRSLRGKNHEQSGPTLLYGQSRRKRVF